MSRYKRWKGVSGSMSYNLSVVENLLKPLGQKFTLRVDGQELPPEALLLGVAANGTCYGGGFTPAPDARTDDGLLNFVFVRKMSRFSISRFIGAYKRGTHLTEPAMAPYIIAREGRKLEVESPKPITVCVDGEMTREERLDIELLPSALTFLLPD